MYKIIWSSKFKRQFKKVLNAPSFKSSVFDQVVNALSRGEVLDYKYHDHQLKGDLQDYRECHLHSDLLLIYKKHNDVLVIVFVKIGSHSELL